MNKILDISTFLANVATIATFILWVCGRWRNYRHQRMGKGEKKETVGNRSL